MFEQRTVLVLGAGASSHAGYYVGATFNQAILNLAGDKAFSLDVARLGHRNLDVFLDQLSHGNYGTPDRLLEENADLEEVGKYCIAKVLTHVENDQILFRGGRPGWYGTLYDRLDLEADDYMPENLSVVTFNYDRSLEHSIWAITNRRCRSDKSKACSLWQARPEIVHVHGVLDVYDPVAGGHRQYGPIENIEQIAAAACQIEVIHTANPDTAEFIRARELLTSAERVVFLGFGFDKQNVDRLGVFNTTEQRQKIEGTLLQPGARRSAYIFDTVFGPGLNARKLENRQIDSFVEDKL